MTAKIILATPGKGLYAAHIKHRHGISVFEVVEGPPLRIGDVIRAKFGYTGRQNAEIPAENKEIVIDIIKNDMSPVAAGICLDMPDMCLPKE